MKRWLRRQRRRWLVWRAGPWRYRWVRCKLCRRIYHPDIWPKPVRVPYTHLIYAPSFVVRVPCGHTFAEARTGVRGMSYS